MDEEGAKNIRQIHIKLSPALHKELKVQAVLRETTIQEYVVRAIEDHVSRNQSETGASK